jgi:hypothetical protein
MVIDDVARPVATPELAGGRGSRAESRYGMLQEAAKAGSSYSMCYTAQRLEHTRLKGSLSRCSRWINREGGDT